MLWLWLLCGDVCDMCRACRVLILRRELPKQAGPPEAGKAVADLLVDAPAAGPLVAPQLLGGRLPRVGLVLRRLGGGLLALTLALHRSLARATAGAGAAGRPPPPAAGAVEVEVALLPALERAVLGVAPIPSDIDLLALVAGAEDEAAPLAGGDARRHREHDADEVRRRREQDLARFVDDGAGDAPDRLQPVVGARGRVEAPGPAWREEVGGRRERRERPVVRHGHGGRGAVPDGFAPGHGCRCSLSRRGCVWRRRRLRGCCG